MSIYLVEFCGVGLLDYLILWNDLGFSNRDGRLTDFLESSVIGSVLTAVRTEPFIIGSVPVPHGNRNRTENKLKYFNRP